MAGGFSALPSGADPRTEQQTKGTDARTGTVKNGKVKIFSAVPRASLSGRGSACPCCACWSLWLAGPGALLLLASVPAFRVFFSCRVCSALCATRPRTGEFDQVHPRFWRSCIHCRVMTICALQTSMGGGQVVLIETVVLEIDILVSSTTDFYITTSVQMKRLKSSSLILYTRAF